ncbi:MAG: GMC oxidoreductase, partial [Myxococcota bacterium]
RLHTLARRLVLEGKRVVGVEIEDAQGQVKRLQASEVVLSAGAYNTPPLLELSGIGDPKVLQGLGIDVCHPLGGVGASLQDHLQLWVQQGVKTRQTLSEDGKFPRVVWSVLRYLATRKGPLAFPAASVGAFVSTTPGERPIFQLHFTPGAGAMDEHGRMVASPEPGVNSTVCVIRPTSRGTVHAADNDPRTPPRILHNYLSTEHDRTLSIEGFRLQRRIYAAEPFARYATHELNPGPEVQSDDEILDFWRREAMSVYHPVGSARMGAADDPGAVVDHELRVHGLEGVRVVDASIFPQIPSGNTHAPVVAVAERAADLILGRPLLPPDSDM